MDIIFNESVKLCLQIDGEGRVMYARLKIEGLPLQPRDNLGGYYPSYQDVLNGLMGYGIMFTEDEISNKELGFYPNSLAFEIGKYF